MSDTPFRITALMFILISILMFIIKPSVFFNSMNQIKVFSINYSDSSTPFPLYIFIYGIMMLMYITLTYIDYLLFK
jgi:hypothetical protein